MNDVLSSARYFQADNRFLFYYSKPLSTFIVCDTRGSYRGAPYSLVATYLTKEAALYVTRTLNGVH